MHHDKRCESGFGDDLGNTVLLNRILVKDQVDGISISDSCFLSRPLTKNSGYSVTCHVTCHASLHKHCLSYRSVRNCVTLKAVWAAG